MRVAYDNLLRTGMPDIGGVWELDGRPRNLEGWLDYWGTAIPMDIDFFPGTRGGWPKSQKTVRDGFEYIEYETGALTRQVLNNDVTYSMPDYMSFHVRDRASFERYKAIRTPSLPWTKQQIDGACAAYDRREKPLRVQVCSTFGNLRDMMGPEMACTVFYDDPELAEDIFAWLRWENRTFWFPLIERLKPDIVMTSEDMCYNHGMFISPKLFEQYCAPAYREIGEVVRAAGVPVFAVDTDGFAEPVLPLLTACGVNALFPWEVKSQNDLYRVRENYPELILLGGLEKECANEGNEGNIRAEIEAKRALIAGGRYFPNGDHGIQPLATFENLCKFMTLLHEVTGNPEGKFPRVNP